MAIYSARRAEPKRGVVRMVMMRTDGSARVHTAAHGIIDVPADAFIDAYDI